MLTHRNSHNMLTWGALGAITGAVLIPMMNNKTRRRLTRTARNAYFRVSDFVQDVKDMNGK